MHVLCDMYYMQASIQLSKAAVQKMTPELTTLPHDNQMGADALFRLFLSPELMVHGTHMGFMLSCVKCIDHILALTDCTQDFAVGGS